MIAFWPFTYPWMLLWATAAAVPIVIHLWSRRRYQELPWAAMAYLLAALRSNARRLRIEQLILLIVRTLILLLLAVALADPALRWTAGLADGGPPAGTTHLILVVDTSYSMGYRQAGTTRLEAARRLASERVHQTRQGDGITLLTLANPPRAVIGQPVFAPEDVLAEIDRLERTDGGGDLLATLALVEETLEQVRQTHERLREARVCWFTDLGCTSWDAAADREGQAAFKRIAQRARLQLVDVGQPAAENLAVVSLRADQDVAVAGMPVRLEAEVENFGTRDLETVRVEFRVDGQRLADRLLKVPAGQRATALAEHPFPAAGQHIVEVRLGDDPLEVDNHRWLSVTVRRALQVLCVEGQVGAARNIALALDPGLVRPPRIQVHVRTENALWEDDLARYDCIFLCNVGQFNAEEAELLYDYLQAGGGLVFVLGDQVDQRNYNKVLGPDRQQAAILPMRLAEATAAGQYALDPLDYRHPIVEPFRGNERAGLLTTPVWKYIPLQPVPAAGVQTALAYHTGDPAIATASVARGRVIVLSTAASDQSVDRSTEPPTPWSALAVWPSFPPLVQQMLDVAVSGHGDVRNVQVGQIMEIALPADMHAASVTVTDPTGTSRRVPVRPRRGRSYCMLSDVTHAGVYKLRWGGLPDQVQRLVANLDTTESRLDRFARQLLPEPFDDPAALAVQPPPQAGPADPAPWFRYILAAVLGLLLSETLLAWRFGRGSV